MLRWPDEEPQRHRQRPALDLDGLLWCGARWTVIPDAQLCIVRLLLDCPSQLVRTSTITTTYVEAGYSGHRGSIRTMLHRLVGRFASVGVELHLVRGKGAILDVPSS